MEVIVIKPSLFLQTLQQKTIGKSTEQPQKPQQKNQFEILKADDDKRLVFGWANIAIKADGEQIEDLQKDVIDPEELENAVYKYVLEFRDGGEEHIPTMRKKASLVESVMFTKEKMRVMGIPEGIVPEGWWIGFYVKDDDAWEKIKNGTYKMFSIEGKAVRVPVDDEINKSDEHNVLKTLNELIEKFNPYHDRLGRFASANRATSFTIRTKDPGKQSYADAASEREKLRTMQSASQSGEKADSGTKDNKMYPESISGVKQGKPMTFEEADNSRTNPHFNEDVKYRINCQTCVVANELRRRGYDVEANPFTSDEAKALSRKTTLAWIDKNTGGSPELLKNHSANTPKRATEWIDGTVKPGERYTMEFAWKSRGNSGHIVCLERNGSGELRIFDPQSGDSYVGNAKVRTYLGRVRLNRKVPAFVEGAPSNYSSLRLLRVDDKIPNINYVEPITRKAGT